MACGVKRLDNTAVTNARTSYHTLKVMYILGMLFQTIYIWRICTITYQMETIL